MNLKDVKKLFVDDFTANFYNFNGATVYDKIIANDEFNLHREGYTKETSKLSIFVRVAYLLILIFIVLLSNYYAFGDKRDYILTYFIENNIDYEDKPVLICCAPKGDEFLIYRGIDRDTDEFNYYGFIFEDRGSKIRYIVFNNISTNESVVIYPDPTVQIVSDLINISEDDIVEVEFHYKNYSHKTNHFTIE